MKKDPSLFSKRDLQEKYQKADTTIYRWIKACGLSTKNVYYTEEEVTTTLDTARTLFSSGYTVKEVREYFNLPPET